MNFSFEDYASDITRICSEYGIKSLTAFGGVLSDEFDEESDIDLLIELDGQIHERKT